MNKTKKRALLSSVAMLIVSAVVLSSATFAWFVAGDTATITGMTATIDSGSSVQVANSISGPWKSTIDWQALNGYKPGALLAVSTGKTVSGSNFFKGVLDGNGVFAATPLTDSLASLGDRVVKLTVYVKSSAPGEVLLTGSTFTAPTLDQAVLCAIVEGATTKIYSASGTATPGAYEGIIKPFTAQDTGNEIIINSEIAPPVPAALESVSTNGNIATHSLNFTTPGEIKTLDIYIWLEGQQAQATGSASSTMNLAITFNKAV